MDNGQWTKCINGIQITSLPFLTAEVLIPATSDPQFGSVTQ